jgi:hypothetical protein
MEGKGVGINSFIDTIIRQGQSFQLYSKEETGSRFEFGSNQKLAKR